MKHVLITLALVSSGCGIGLACTEIGCDPNTSVTIRPASGEFEPGVYTVLIETDTTSSSCTFQIVDVCSEEESRCLSESDCTMVFVADEAGTESGNLFVDGAPAEFTVTATLAEAEVGKRTFTPDYQETRPNGPDCDPVCLQPTQPLVLELTSS